MHDRCAPLCSASNYMSGIAARCPEAQVCAAERIHFVAYMLCVIWMEPTGTHTQQIHEIYTIVRCSLPLMKYYNDAFVNKQHRARFRPTRRIQQTKHTIGHHVYKLDNISDTHVCHIYAKWHILREHSYKTRVDSLTKLREALSNAHNVPHTLRPHLAHNLQPFTPRRRPYHPA